MNDGNIVEQRQSWRINEKDGFYLRLLIIHNLNYKIVHRGQTQYKCRLSFYNI